MTAHNTFLTLVNDPIISPAGHTVATGSILLTLANWLNPTLTTVAVILSIIWYGVTIYESKTFKSFSIRFRAHLARVLKLKGHKKAGQKMAEKALADAKAVVVETKGDAALAADTVEDAKQAVAAPPAPDKK